jgi:hypothetical protein
MLLQISAREGNCGRMLLDAVPMRMTHELPSWFFF